MNDSVNNVDVIPCAICEELYSMDDLFEYKNGWICNNCLCAEDDELEDARSEAEDE